MSIRIRYAYMKDQTWMYRRNYPADVRLIVGSCALKQSLRTSDPKVARQRVAELNTRYEEVAATAREKGHVVRDLVTAPVEDDPGDGDIWERATRATVAQLRAVLGGERVALPPVVFQCLSPRIERQRLIDVAKVYLRKRGTELQPGGFKSVRYAIDLLVSSLGSKPIGALSREDGRAFVRSISSLSPTIGKSYKTRGLTLDQLVAFSETQPDVISVRTQKRILSQVTHFLDWAVYEGHIGVNPFASVRIDQKVKPAPYAVLTDTEVRCLLADRQHSLYPVLLFCLLTGMRAGEAVGLLREDLVDRGNLGVFALVRPNRLRSLKTAAAERVVPLHAELLPLIPADGPVFPELSVSIVTKRFATLRRQLALTRPGLVFHSTRKWFVTQCERAGVPEHFTASLVGHQSARSENKLTYSIYSAGISDEQKRGIIDSLRLPA